MVEDGGDGVGEKVKLSFGADKRGSLELSFFLRFA